MFAIRQMIDDLPEFIPVPPELRHRPTEVIFIALDAVPEVATVALDGGGQGESRERAEAAVTAFRGKGKGGAVARLLQDRQSERERDA
jgi:hypothetical protein